MNDAPEHFDLVIIGTGSGNSLVTPEMEGRRVAIIERGAFGGTCLNVGCIPTKMFVYAAEVATTIRESARFGIDASLDGVRWRDIRDRIFARIDPISEGGRRYRQESPGTTAYLGDARFTGPRTVQVELDSGGTAVLTGDQVVIAAGARPVLPPVLADADADVPVYTSDTVMRIDELPRTMTIVGGGFVACEFAHVFASLGVQVTVVNRGTTLLRHLDSSLCEPFTEHAREQWDVRLGTEVTAARRADGADRSDAVELELSDGATLHTDLLLVATGRTPNTEDLGLAAAGVATHPDGRVVADEHGRATAEGVWTLGDVSSPHELKHVANHEARVVAHNLTHPDAPRTLVHEQVPFAVFTHPQIASVGMTQEQAGEAGLEVTIKTQRFGDTAYGWAMEDTTGLCTVLADRRTGRLLGAHIMGPHASTLIQPLIQALSLGTPPEQVARGQYWIHPALAEVVENALLGLDIPATVGEGIPQVG